MYDIIVCTSTKCKYKDTCVKRLDINPDDELQTYYNFESICNESNYYKNYTPINELQL